MASFKMSYNTMVFSYNLKLVAKELGTNISGSLICYFIQYRTIYFRVLHEFVPLLNCKQFVQHSIRKY